MREALGAPAGPTDSPAVVQQGFRDLMSLLMLPALWLGRDAETMLLLMTQAIERIVPFDVSFVEIQVQADQATLSKLRPLGGGASPGAEQRWQDTLAQFRAMPISTAPKLIDTPLGPLRTVRLSMGYTAKGGSAWFASRHPAFPGVTETALMRAATTLLATGLQGVKVDHERVRASRVKDEFLAMLGHELRNPLAPIFTSLELIKRQNGLPLSKPLAIIERQARHMSRLVDDLLDVSRIINGKIEIEKKPVSLHSTLRLALEAVEPLMTTGAHHVTARLPDESITLLGDATRLVQLFVNLLTNAAKYTPRGGRIVVDTTTGHDTVVVSIQDSGQGISPELMLRLFDIFEQGGSGIERASGGLGVGLALVRSFAELHGGTVWAESEGTGHGAVFKVCLPVQAVHHEPVAEAQLQSLPVPAATGEAVPRRVMLVDDNLDALETTAEVLRFSGFEVATAGSPAEALALMDAFAPDVAILDVGLPEMDGYQLGQAMRMRRAPTEPLRLITLSGYGTLSDHDRSAQAGFERHLVKPVDIDELMAILRA